MVAQSHYDRTVRMNLHTAHLISHLLNVLLFCFTAYFNSFCNPEKVKPGPLFSPLLDQSVTNFEIIHLKNFLPSIILFIFTRKPVQLFLSPLFLIRICKFMQMFLKPNPMHSEIR